MINLLPEQQQKEINKEYAVRRIAVGVMLLCALIGFALVLLLPSFILAYYRERAAVGRVTAHDEAVQKEHADLQKSLADYEVLVKILRANDMTIMPSKIITLVMDQKTSSISISNVSFTIKDKVPQLEVVGIARDRQSLLSFTSALEREPLISKATVPVSDFAKDTNLEFTATIVIKTP